MFTVVIAQQAYIDKIREYEIFLKPFLNKDKIVFCPWDQEGQTLAASVPTLTAAVARREHWRAVVVCCGEGLKEKNPFQAVRFTPPPRPPRPKLPPELREEEDDFPTGDTPWLREDREAPEDSWDYGARTQEQEEEEARLRDYCAQVLEAKRAAFQEAASKPLTRLMTHLCEQPLVSEGRNGARKDALYEAYQNEALCKEAIRREILGDEKVHIFLPEEIYCVALRTFQEPEYDVRSSWSRFEERRASRFYDWNLYFDKMRYLVFDIVPASHQNYTYDYLRFLCALLLLAGNGAPAGCLQPRRVYTLTCENDEEALRRLISSYDAKLRNTEAALEEEVRALAEKTRGSITDAEASALFCAKMNVPVTLDESFDESGLYVDPHGYGLAADCPAQEDVVWEAGYRSAEKTLYRLAKQPRRSLKRAVENLRHMNEAGTDQVKLLNEFQLEDLREFVGDADMGMVTTPTRDICDLTRYSKQMEEADRDVREELEKRMTRGTALGLGAAVLGIFLLCFLPLLFGNRLQEGSLTASLALMGSALGATALAGLICLIRFHFSLRDHIRGFNEVMRGISAEMHASLLQFSLYLSHACGMMRGWSAINYYNEHEDADTLQIRIRRKHVQDIRGYRERLHEIFGVRFTDPDYADPVLSQPYLYNFARPVDFDYSVPFMSGENRQIEYMQPGSEITVPVNFVGRLAVKQEDLYDEHDE